MSDETPTAADKDNKAYQAPKGATCGLTWTSEAGDDAAIDVISEWSVLRKKERPAAEMFHTYYRLAAAKGRRPVSFVFNGGPGASSAYLHGRGLPPPRGLFQTKGHLPPPPRRPVNKPTSLVTLPPPLLRDSHRRRRP